MRYLILPLLSAIGLSCAAPNHVYLTWRGDTGTTMVVNYHTSQPAETRVYYDTEPRGATPAEYRYASEGEAHQIPGLRDGRFVHSVELSGLEPGGTYYFAVERGGAKAEEFHFRSIPSEATPLRFIVGGDMGVFPKTWQLLDEAARQDPDFVVIGGDIAYANGSLRNSGRWDVWLRQWQKRMRRSDGALVPMVAAIGNHETNDDLSAAHLEPERVAPFYLGYLDQGGSSYFARHFGPNLVLFVLDSGHIAHWGGAQRAWLADALAANAGVKHKIAAYHIPMYPSHRDFNDERMVAARTHWLPLFDEFAFDAAFEHHEHTHKRTVPLRGGVADPEGTVYLGDGSFGVPVRSVDLEGRDYLAAASGTGHFWLVELDANGLRYQAINHHGDVFDAWPED